MTDERASDQRKRIGDAVRSLHAGGPEVSREEACADVSRDRSLDTRAHRYGLRAEDAVNQTVLKLLRAHGELSQVPVPEDSTFPQFLRRTSFYTLLDMAKAHHRREARRVRVEPEVAESMVGAEDGSDPAGETGPIAADHVALLKSAVERLTPKLRDVIERRYVEGITLESIARETDSPPATIRSRHMRALEKLRDTLEGSSVAFA